MRLVPLSYPLRSMTVRWSSSLFSAIGIALTVAVFAGVLALRQGFTGLYAETGRDDVGVYLRPGAQSEGESLVRYPGDTQIVLSRPEVAVGRHGEALAASESYLGINLQKLDGSGTTIVTVRGVEPASLEIQGSRLRLVEGRMFQFGTDEVIVGRRLAQRMKDCAVGDAVLFNVRPFKVVGLFEQDGAYASEIWGDVVQITSATQRPFRQRIVALLRPGTDTAALADEIEHDKRVPLKFMTERDYYRAQTGVTGGVLLFLATFLVVLMGVAATLGAVNTMLASVGARTREVGVLVSLGYRSFAVFVSFLIEAAAIGGVGGLLGCAVVLPLSGIETSTTNMNTFTEVTFAFRVSPDLLAGSVLLSIFLGVVGGAYPAWRASRMPPTAALRRL
jgi:putative ABC transport system permease protein